MIHDIIPVRCVSHTKIAKVEYDSVIRDSFVPASNKFLVHLSRISEWPATELDDALVAEVCVRGEPDVLGVESRKYIFPDFIRYYHNAISWERLFSKSFSSTHLGFKYLLPSPPRSYVSVTSQLLIGSNS